MPEDLRRPDDLGNPGSAAALGPEAALRLQVIRQQALLDRQAGSLTEQTAQIALLATRLHDSDTRIGDLIAEVQALRGELAALRASNSWRITGPGRALRRASWWLGRQGRAIWAGIRRPRSKG